MFTKFTKIVLPIFVIAIFILAGCGEKKATDVSHPSTVSIIDDTGATIAIPAKITRIADAWPAHTEVLFLLGSGQNIVATNAPAKTPWMLKINPSLANTTNIFGQTDVNVEELLKSKPDIIFMPGNMKNSKQLKELGLPAVQMNITDFDTLKSCIIATGKILGPEASQRASDYIFYLDQKIDLIQNRTRNIPNLQKPRILHISSLKPLTVDGENSLISAWITMAGGINAAKTDAPGSAEISIEQLIKWNPDIIIFGNTALSESSLSTILQDPSWQRLRAVQNKAIYTNPEGMFYWDRYGVEEALQIQWAAKIFYPDKFSDIDLCQETQYFYQKFFNYTLSSEDAVAMLKGMPPAE